MTFNKNLLILCFCILNYCMAGDAVVDSDVKSLKETEIGLVDSICIFDADLWCSVMAHELGHKLSANVLGYDAEIIGFGMTKVTGAMSKGESIAMFASGPIAGVTFDKVIYELIKKKSKYLGKIASALGFINLINFIPCHVGELPSDGHHILKDLGFPQDQKIITQVLATIIVLVVWDQMFDRPITSLFSKMKQRLSKKKKEVAKPTTA